MRFGHVTNFVLGACCGCLYLVSLAYVAAVTPIWPTSFLSSECRDMLIADLTNRCRYSNLAGLMAYDFLHCLVVAIALAAGVVAIHKFLARHAPKYSFPAFTAGFLAAWAIAATWMSNGLLSLGWLTVASWSLQLFVFLACYYFIANRVFQQVSASNPSP